MQKSLKPFAIIGALGLLSLAPIVSAQAQSPANLRTQCYPATEKEPLEEQVVVDGSGRTFWELFEKEVALPFTKKCGVKVVMTVNPSRPFSQVLDYGRRGNSPWDISFVNKVWEFDEGVKTGAFEKFPADFWKPLSSELFQGSSNDYGTWLSRAASTVIYNPKVFPQGMKTAADFWDVKTFPGPRSIQNSPHNIVIALMAAGIPKDKIYPITDDKLRLAFQKLTELRSSISNFWVATDQPIQGVHRGDFVAAIVFSGRASAGIIAGYDVKISWADHIYEQAFFIRPKGSKSPRAAAAMLYFFNQNPEVEAALAKVTGYSYANKGFEKFLSKQEVDNLATSYADQGAELDYAWWSANGARVSQLWTEWVTSGKVPL